MKIYHYDPFDPHQKKWDDNFKSIEFNFIVDKRDAERIFSRLLDDVHRNLISIRINTKWSKHSVEIGGIITIIEPVIGVAIGLILAELKMILQKYQDKQRFRRHSDFDY